MNSKQSRLDYLISILRSLDEEELASIKQYLVCFDPNFAENHKVKTLQLLEYLLDNHLEVYEEALIDELYGKKKGGNAFKFVCMRLINKIYDWFTLDIAIERKAKYLEKTRTYLSLAKKLGQIKVLWEKGITGDIPKMLNQIVKSAKDFELYEQAIEALSIKQAFMGLRSGINEFEKIGRHIEDLEKIKRAIKAASDCFSLIKYQANLKAGKPEITELINEKLDDVRKNYEQYNSGQLGYYYYFILLAKNSMEDDFEQGSLNCLRLLDLINRHNSLNSSASRGSIYLQLANTELHNNKVHNSRKYAIEGTKHFPTNSINYYFGKEVEAASCFYLEYFDEAEACCKTIVESRVSQANKPLLERTYYRYAALLFLKKDFKGAYGELQKVSSLLNDKAGWNVGVRLLQIMIQIESHQIDLLELSLDNLRKHISKLIKENVIKERYRVIYKLLNVLKKNSLDFSIVSDDTRDMLKLLSSDDPEYSWHYTSPELIRFHEWYKEKIKYSQ